MKTYVLNEDTIKVYIEIYNVHSTLDYAKTIKEIAENCNLSVKRTRKACQHLLTQNLIKLKYLMINKERLGWRYILIDKKW